MNPSTARIERVDLIPLLYPTVGYFKFFEGARGAMGRAAILVRITSDDGTVGHGQSVPIPTWSDETIETAYVALRDYFAPALLGRDPRDLDGAHAALRAAIAPAFSDAMPLARAGIDIALHDLAGKLDGVPVAQLWDLPVGGPVTLSWTVNARSIDEADAMIDQGRERGYRNFNIKVAPDPDFDVALARHVRQRVPDGFLWADANGGYDPDSALRAAPRLADVGVEILESPLRPNRIDGYRALRRQGALPILMDEGVISTVELEEFLRLEMLDGIAAKPSRCAGLLPNLRQIALARRHGLLWLGSGLCDPDVALAASIALYAACGIDRPAALNGPQFLDAGILRDPPAIRDATIHPNNGPGLGIEIDEAKLEQLAQQTRQRLPHLATLADQSNATSA